MPQQVVAKESTQKDARSDQRQLIVFVIAPTAQPYVDKAEVSLSPQSANNHLAC